MFSGQPANSQPQPLGEEPIQPEIPQGSKFNFIKNIKLWQIAVLLILLIPTTAFFLGRNQIKPTTIVQSSPTPTPDPTANWKIFKSALGGFNLKYPSDWITQGFEGAEKESFSENSDIVRFYSKAPSKNAVNGDYVCVEFKINSNDNYQLTNGQVISTLNNGLLIYQAKENYSGTVESVRSWLTDKNFMSLINLPSDKKLLTHVEFNCVQGDLDRIRLTFNQQIKSKEYQQAIEILKSVKF